VSLHVLEFFLEALGTCEFWGIRFHWDLPSVLYL
jgi:hypothetical protein